MRFNHWIIEGSAAFADIGTFLPFFIGLVMVAGLDPVGLLVGFGTFAVGSAMYYRRPIPVQPMKVVGAMVISGLVSIEAMVATGFCLGLILLVLSCTDLIGRLKQMIPKSVLLGLRLALAFGLVFTIMQMYSASPSGVVALVITLCVAQNSPLKPIACILILILGIVIFGQVPSDMQWVWTLALPNIEIPQVEMFHLSLSDTILSQLALTLTNALILTSFLASELFPDDRGSITERKLARTTGIANILCTPLGCIPMCHGAGGLAAHHAFGSRTGLAVGIFGVICLIGGLMAGSIIVPIMASIPAEVVITLVLFAAWVLADPKALIQLRPSRQLVVCLMVPCVFMFGPFLGLVAGITLEYLRAKILQLR